VLRARVHAKCGHAEVAPLADLPRGRVVHKHRRKMRKQVGRLKNRFFQTAAVLEFLKLFECVCLLDAKRA
jgi:hypothetical protein